MIRAVRVLVAAVLAAAAAIARAEPYLAVQQGLQCATCHVNPTGGGLRSAYGALFARNAIPMQAAPAALPNWTGSPVPGLRLGTDLRAGVSRLEVPGQPAQSRDGIDQWRVYLDVEPIADHVGLVLDEQLRPGEPLRLESYLRLSTADHRWYAKAGRFYLPFGWRLQDAGTFVRTLSGIGMTTPDQGAELGFQGDEWSIQFVASRGPGNRGPVTGHQRTVQAVWTRPEGRIGAAFAQTASSAGDRDAVALFGGLRTGPVAWLAELDWVADDGFPEGRRRQVAGLGEANWGIARGHNLKLDAEWLDPDRRVRHDHKVRYSAVYELTPFPYVQFRVGLRRWGGIPRNDFDNRRSLFLELHLYL
jgi:hypothetical protein